MDTFPTDIEPNISSATGCSDSYRWKVEDSTISTQTDAGYKHTRSRNTRMIQSFTFSWVAVPKKKFQRLLSFYKQHGTFKSFYFVHPLDGKTYTVRFAKQMEWQYQHPYGWTGSFCFEEV